VPVPAVPAPYTINRRRGGSGGGPSLARRRKADHNGPIPRETLMNWPALAPIFMLSISNVFMTFAWYGQLKFPDRPLWLVIVVSWMIAFVEYCFAVPANRIGYTVYSGAQLKTMQEIITLLVFGVFSVLYLGEALRWNHLAAFGCLVLAGYFAFVK
jgi:uncharacterized protein (DUF486 family)